ncbi:AAEL017509-PA [Aedes aegypti]|uniref:AAEL017509-PA n=1 Tax=Aedes aegypti TaxID=7159 RepID=J9EAT0_AEDAE|nr:AAEL017509-PA [Aedes aegypti]
MSWFSLLNENFGTMRPQLVFDLQIGYSFAEVLES